jgi:hypothetical protein
MKNKFNIVGYFGLMVTIITTLLVWYSDFDVKHIKNQSEKTYLSDEQAVKILVTFEDDKHYFYETTSLVENTKTLIPLWYSKKVLSASKRELKSEDCGVQIK